MEGMSGEGAAAAAMQRNKRVSQSTLSPLGTSVFATRAPPFGLQYTP